MDHIGLIATILGSAVGATWVLRSKLSDIESAFSAHVAATKHELETLGAKIIRLESRRKSK